MSGTSLDGVDFILISKTTKGLKYKDMGSVAYPKKIKGKILSLAEGNMGFRDAQFLHFDLGQFYAKSLRKIKEQKKWKFDLIGLHGQTVFHSAPKATSQIGEPSFLKEFDVPVVSDFRAKILSLGGQGAPLAPIFHNEIMGSQKKWAFLNIGGMSNISFKEGTKLMASDVGLGNVYLDAAMRKIFSKNYDEGGKTASKGIPDLKVAKNYLSKNKFIKKALPKSCGRKDFPESDLIELLKKMKGLSKEDVLATLSEITLIPIVKEMKKRRVETLVVSGGGAYNNYLLKRLEESLQDVDVFISDEMGWPVQAVEGAAFALLAEYKFSGTKVDLSYMGFSKKLSPLGRID